MSLIQKGKKIPTMQVTCPRCEAVNEIQPADLIEGRNEMGFVQWDYKCLWCNLLATTDLSDEMFEFITKK